MKAYMDFLDKSCHKQLPLRKNGWALQRRFLGVYNLASGRNYLQYSEM